MRSIIILFALGGIITMSLGQSVESTIFLPDTLSGLQQVWSFVYHSPSSRVYVGGDSDFLVAVDARANTKLAKVPVGARPLVLCSDPPGDKVYCAKDDASLTVVDASTNQPIKTLATERVVTDLVYNELEDKLYCGNGEDSLVRVIDCGSDCMIARVPVSVGPYSLCYSRPLNRVYCAHLARDEVSVIDCAADTAVGTAWIHGVEPLDICYDSATNCVYIANAVSNTVSVMDCDGDTIVRVLPAGQQPEVIAAGPPGKVCCANFFDSSVAVISGGAVKTVRTCTYPRSLSYDPVNGKVYCASDNQPVVTVIDAESDTVLSNVETGTYTLSAVLCYDSAGNSTYVGTDYDHIAVVGDESDTVDAVIQFGPARPGPLCFSEANDQLYCLDPANHTLYVIDGDSSVVLKTLDTRSTYSDADTLIWNPVSNKVYITNSEDGTVSILDCANDSITATVATGAVPCALACGGDGKVYVANLGGGVAVIDGSGDSVRTVLPVGSNPWSLCYDYIDNKVYVGWHGGDTLSVIDASVDSLIASVPIPVHLFAEVCWNPNENKVYVAGRRDESLAVIDCTADTVLTNIGVTTGLVRLYSDSVCNKVYGVDVDNRYLRIVHAATDTFYGSLYVGYVTAILDNGKPGPANRLYCAQGGDGTVAVVAGYKTDSILKRLAVGEGPSALARNPKHSWMYVSNEESSSITVIHDTFGLGVEENLPQASSHKPQATVVRGVLVLNEPGTRSELPECNSFVSRAVLLDVSGRKVLDLKPGANDVRALAPGVYFVHEAVSDERPAVGVRKVIITR
jgi:YVTN family beta-propeller protein